MQSHDSFAAVLGLASSASSAVDVLLTSEASCESARNSRCEETARRHVGHCFFRRSEALMQPSQKRWPQAVTTGESYSSRHIGQHQNGALERAASLVVIEQLRAVSDPLRFRRPCF